jgi:hypothetical protein
MRLADRIAQCSTPFIVQDPKTGRLTHLNNAATLSNEIAGCATRFVLSDELTRLCTALAYSKGAGMLARVRARVGKPALLDQMEVHSPIMPEYQFEHAQASAGFRRRSRLHHVRGHLVRRGAKLFWRVPHLRGSAAAGFIRARTVTWEFEPTHAASPVGI